MPQPSPGRAAGSASVREVFLVFLRLGLTSFGGPVAHLGYFREEFVVRRHWMSEGVYADLVALCQFLPGPASSQVGMAVGLYRAGYAGALAAWCGFTLPSALILILFAQSIATWGDILPNGVLHGLKVVAVAVVSQAVWGMARNLCRGAPHISIMAVAACSVLLWPSALGQIGVILAAGALGLWCFNPDQPEARESLPIRGGRIAAGLSLGLFLALLLGLPVLAAAWPNQPMQLVDAFYRTGSLVFGGGHVVLPLLQAEVVPPGWVGNDDFLAGYGAAQAVPGPLFSFSAFLGAVSSRPPNGWLGGLLCLIAIYVPSFLLVIGTLPFWARLRGSVRVRAALAGINASVVGLLLAALYRPVWISAIHGPGDFGLALLALVALTSWKLPPWLVVLLSGVAGWLLALLG